MHNNESSKAFQQVNARLRRLEAEYCGTLVGAFAVLEQYDSETAQLALDAMENRDNAALWFGDHVGSLSGRTPWECLAAGDVNQVRRVLNAIVYGLPA